MTEPRPRTGERGFTLIEILIVLVIISVLALGLWVAMQSVRVSSRNDAMKAAAATIDQGASTYNRMYPPVAGQPDLITRGSATWSGNTGTPSSGMADETGEWLVAQWPDNPFGTGGVVVTRYATPAGCASGQPGQVKICRMGGGASAQSYEIHAWGRNAQRATIEVYRAQHSGG